MAMTGFICHDDYLSKTAKLTDEELGRLFRALMVYHSTGEETSLELRESIAFDFIREDIDRAEKKYKDKCDKNREIRLAAVDNERQRTSTNVSERDQYKEKEKNNNKNNNKRFTPPTIEDVAAYCKEIGFDIDPQYFLDYQTARNWVLSNGKQAKDWKAVLRTWAHNNFSKPKAKSVTAQEYTQRSYASEQQEAMERMLAEYGNTG